MKSKRNILYRPQDDITVQELSKILGFFINTRSGCSGVEGEKLFEALSDNVKRHLELV